MKASEFEALYLKVLATHLAQFIADQLRDKAGGHRAKVTDLPLVLMRAVCERIRAEVGNLEAYLLSDNPINPSEITATQLIERRNISDKVVLVFIPIGLKTAAEDSYGEHTFETIQIKTALRILVRKLSTELAADFPFIEKIVLSPHARQLSLENQVRYLLAVKTNRDDKQAPGHYLYHLGLIPDLKLEPDRVQNQIDRNSKAVNILIGPDKPLDTKIEMLKLAPNSIQNDLFRQLHTSEAADPDRWLPAMLEANLTFDHWQPAESQSLDQPPIVAFEPLNKFKGLTEDEGDYVADLAKPIQVTWKITGSTSTAPSHFVLILVREDREDEELLPPRRVTGNKRTSKFALKEVELDEEEGRVAAKLEIRAISSSGDLLSNDFSEPFWIEKGISGIVTEEIADSVRNPHGDEVRNIAEALLRGAYRWREASNRQTDVAINLDRSGWASSSKSKGAAQDLYRVRLTTNAQFHIKIVPFLANVEREILDQPEALRAYTVSVPSSQVLAANNVDARPLQFSDVHLSAFRAARKTLFSTLTNATSGALVDVLDLRPYLPDILAYVDAYLDLLHNLSGDRAALTELGQLDILTLHLPSFQSEAALLAPTHPLRLLWLLQYQRVLAHWTEGIIVARSDDLPSLFDLETLDKITSLNCPAFLALANRIYLNTDNLSLAWSLFLPAPVERGREVVGLIARALRTPITRAEVSAIGPAQLSQRIGRYLDQHRYITTLKVNVINPGDGMVMLDALRDLQNDATFDDLRYDLRFFGSHAYDQTAVAFDDLMAETDERRRSEADEAFLSASSNPLIPKLSFAKHLLTSFTQGGDFESHLSVLFDPFRVTLRPTSLRPEGGSTSLHGLLNEYITNFDPAAGLNWSRSVQTNLCLDLSASDEVAKRIHALYQTHLAIVVGVLGGDPDRDVPAVELQLAEADRSMLTHTHAISDWVFTIDRHFGVEYFDNPIPLDGRQSYLIDYVPEFLSDIGQRLIISTAWLNETEALLRHQMRQLSLFSEYFRPQDVLASLKSLSGRLALGLLGNPAGAQAALGLAMATRVLKHHGQLVSSILIPCEAHPDIFAARGNPTHSGLTIATFKDKALLLTLLGVRFKTGGIAEEASEKDEIRKENDVAEATLRRRFSPAKQEPLDIAVKSQRWAGLLSFYLDRAIRYGQMEPASSTASTIRTGIAALRQGKLTLNIEKEGLIFNLTGLSKPAENVGGNRITVIGRDDINALIRDKSPVVEVASPSSTPLAFLPETNLPPSVAPLGAPHQEAPVELISAATESQSVEILIGDDCDTGRPVIWAPHREQPKRLTNQHILIVGKSGSGKTQTTMTIVRELWRHSIASLILDFHGEYCDQESGMFRASVQADVLDAAQGLPINPLTIPLDPLTDQPSDYRNVVYQVTESLSDIFGLGNIQKRLLKRTFEETYRVAGFTRKATTWTKPAPSFEQAWETLQEIARQEKGSARNLVARVEPLFEADIFQNPLSSQTFSDWLKKVTVIRLSSLANKELRTAVSRFILQKIYESMLALGPSTRQRLFCVIDEAHKLAHDPTVTDLIKEARKYGIGLILSSQETRDFDESLFANTGTLIALQLEIEDAKVMAGNLGLLQPSDRTVAAELIMRQRPGQALFRNNHYSPYVQVQISKLG